MSESQLSKNERKGRRHEREAMRIVRLVYRFASRVTDTASPNGRTDLFSCADLIAVRAGWPTKFIQVKTNKRPKLNSWVSAFVDNEYTQFEYWSRFDYEGWEIYAYIPHEGEKDEMELVLELDTSMDRDEARDEYKAYLADRWGISKKENESEP